MVACVCYGNKPLYNIVCIFLYTLAPSKLVVPESSHGGKKAVAPGPKLENIAFEDRQLRVIEKFQFWDHQCAQKAFTEEPKYRHP